MSGYNVRMAKFVTKKSFDIISDGTHKKWRKDLWNN